MARPTNPRAFPNGRLPAHVLSPIPGPGNQRLYWIHAAYWNAMCAEARARGMAVPVPCGGKCSYRDLAGQYYSRRNACARGQCYMAAVPGTSGHGYGTTVDLGDGGRGAYRRTVNLIGSAWGIAKRWSDASWEPWHIAVHPEKASRRPSRSVRVFTIKKRQRNTKRRRLAIRKLERILNDYQGVRITEGKHYWRGLRDAVKRFQKRNHLRADGVVGPKTWRALLRYQKER